MKKLFLLCILVLFCACDIDDTHTVTISILADRTDTIIPEPRIEDITSLIDIDAQPNTGAEIRFQNIGDVDFLPVYPLSLKPSGLFDNTLQRKSDVKRFIHSVDTLITHHNNKEYYYKRSSILFSLLDHLTTIKESNADEKYVILYSDITEFSDLFDSYRSQNLLLEDPAEIARDLKDKIDIPDLSEVTLYIQYHPSTAFENRMFKAWCSVYQTLFEDSGLEIQIGMTNLSDM